MSQKCVELIFGRLATDEELRREFRRDPLGTLGKLAARLETLPGLHLTGNAYRGVSVASLMEDAERTAERVLGE